MLLAAGANVGAKDASDNTALHHAAQGGTGAAAEIKVLLAAGADVNARNADGQTPLYNARFSKNPWVFQTLLVAGADVNVRDNAGQTPLHAAFWNPTAVAMLVTAGADLNARDTVGRTPLFEAAESPEAFERLVAAGADLDVRDNNGRTLLHAAARGMSSSVVKLLVAAGADVNARANDGWTPLHVAVIASTLPHTGRSQWQRTVVVEALLAAGADVNARANNGWTPLHTAARLNLHGPLVVEVLLAAGADVNIRSEQGETPLDMPFRDPSIGETLRAHPSTPRPAATDVQERPVREASGTTDVGDVEVFRDCSTCPELVVIRAGRFQMGCVSGSPDCNADEWPVNEVEVASFALGRYEVTFEEYDRFVEVTGHRRPDDGGWGRRRRPVINVSWEDAVAYTGWLSAETGERYRLPSESEWEYAARAGTTTQYSWGQDIGRNRANCYGCGSRWDDAQTSPVGSFDAHAWGLEDMHGNVWEWVHDWEHNYDGSLRDWSSSRRVLRGGSWNNHPWDLRLANRTMLDPTTRKHNIGFRVARLLGESL